MLLRLLTQLEPPPSRGFTMSRRRSKSDSRFDLTNNEQISLWLPYASLQSIVPPTKNARTFLWSGVTISLVLSILPLKLPVSSSPASPLAFAPSFSSFVPLLPLLPSVPTLCGIYWHPSLSYDMTDPNNL